LGTKVIRYIHGLPGSSGLRFFSAADLVLMLEAARRQGPYRQVMHRAVNACKPFIIDEIGYLPMSREQANLFFPSR
jgi:DNA replication protein DnaC